MKPWLSWLLNGVLVIAVLVVVRGLAQVSVGNINIKAGDAVRFPEVTGLNLEGRKYNLPKDFEGELNMVALAFFGNHQALVNTWTPLASRLTREYSKLHFYEIPTLTKENGIFRSFIDGGMRSGIPDKAAREATITLYLDRAAFLKIAGLPNDRTIYVLLVDRRGTIYWRGDGMFTPELGAALENVIKTKKL